LTAQQHTQRSAAQRSAEHARRSQNEGDNVPNILDFLLLTNAAPSHAARRMTKHAAHEGLPS